MEEHITNYRAARELTDRRRNAGEGAAGLSRNGLRKQTAGLSKSGAKKGARNSAVKNGAKGMSDMAGKAAR